jgi:hypothetical protein
MPSEIVGEKNSTLRLIDNYIPYATNLTPFEIGMIMFRIFTNLFHYIMNVSRLIDITPAVMVQDSLKKVNRNHAKTLTVLKLFDTEYKKKRNQKLEEEDQLKWGI